MVKVDSERTMQLRSYSLVMNDHSFASYGKEFSGVSQNEMF